MTKLAKISQIGSGKISTKDIISRLNKKAGTSIAYDLQEENPTDVKDWISTGSRWLDSITCKGKLAGVPVGKITEIAIWAAIKDFPVASKPAANAQKKGVRVVYFDSESAIDSNFLVKSGS